jgi:hypothetical protein
MYPRGLKAVALVRDPWQATVEVRRPGRRKVRGNPVASALDR